MAGVFECDYCDGRPRIQAAHRRAHLASAAHRTSRARFFERQVGVGAGRLRAAHWRTAVSDAYPAGGWVPAGRADLPPAPVPREPSTGRRQAQRRARRARRGPAPAPARPDEAHMPGGRGAGGAAAGGGAPAPEHAITRRQTVAHLAMAVREGLLVAPGLGLHGRGDVGPPVAVAAARMASPGAAPGRGSATTGPGEARSDATGPDGSTARSQAIPVADAPAVLAAGLLSVPGAGARGGRQRASWPPGGPGRADPPPARPPARPPPG
ncbi:hypothetical protein H696_04220 [Fonticula alba]|uniref:Uncharacterized protein n=1 Tax=Fonticula alba TaxID=691883 RepID=A0A058Z3T7_FONAL|nr:hypothetical protein H696_04220 [Fonticula alba]KCV68801.1 hypothetical protein H696_04220 [Fonticula alba]|eukprot:XP_009496372.1 hypothetical protein H696_04220 [Fonticula alba]